jgi:hypothetical protein
MPCPSGGGFGRPLFRSYRKATSEACAGYLPRILNTDAYADAREHRPGRILGADLHLAGLQRCRRGNGSVPDRKEHLAIISVTVHLMLWRLAPVHRFDPILCVHDRLARVRGRAVFCNALKVICAVQSGLQKYSAFAVGQISSTSLRHPVPKEGRWPSSRTLGRDAVDAAASGALVFAGRFP